MATKVSNLNPVTTINKDDLVYVVKDGLSKRISKSDFEDSLNIGNTTAKIISGGMVWVSGLTYKSINLVYAFGGSTWTIPDNTMVTLNAAPTTGTDKRIDVIYGDDSGSLGVAEGTPAETPITPTLQPYQLQLHIAILDTNATEPDGVSDVDIYTENAGQPTEWDATENTSGARLDLASTTDPISGTYSIQTLSALNLGDIITFSKDTSLSFSALSSFNFDILLQADWQTSYIILAFYDNGVTKANYVIDRFILDFDNTSTVQTIYVFKNDMSFASNATQFDEIKMYFRVAGGGDVEFTLDNVGLNIDEGAVQPIIVNGGDVSLDTTNFDNNLDSTITDVQKLADAVDELGIISTSKEVFDGDGVEDTFTTSSAWVSIDVVLDRVPQIEGVDYTYSGTSLVMTETPVNGSKIVVRGFAGSNKEEISVTTNGQLSFTISSSSENVEVYLDRVCLIEGIDYTVSGNSLNLIDVDTYTYSKLIVRYFN